MSESSASSYTPNKPSNRRFRIPSNPWLPYIGDCRALTKFLNSKKGVGWLIPKCLNALLRGVSQVVLANNPLAGLVILIALFWSDVFVGLAATVAATTAILTAVLMRQDPSSIEAGLTTYNAVLVGTVTSSLWTPLYGEAVGITVWTFIIIGAALSVFVTSAISTILSSLKIPLPALTLPFNVVTILIFICLMPMNHEHFQHNGNASEPVALRLRGHEPLVISSNLLHEHHLQHISRQIRSPEDDGVNDNEPASESSSEALNWGRILSGIVLSAGQVYGVNNELGSVLIYIGIMIYSPILFMMSVFGAILGTSTGLFFTEAPYTDIYNGIWGYNGLLSASSVGGFFIVLTCHSFFNAMVNVIFTVLIQQALSLALGSLHLPVFTFPFVLSTLLFLSVATSGNQLPRVQNITFPEMHRYNYRETRRVKREEKRGQLPIDELPEEKELVLTDVKVINEETTVAQVEVIAGDSPDDNDTKESQDAE
ncbi:unnamed protein product [Orchesella dallaii]|uniref:Urea transporter 1 n=1 Tax=Orchesella dallaii TaxID=48710 RepID=A0ABP1QMR1_9HEXA